MRITILQGAFLPVPALRGGAVEKMWHALARDFTARGHAVTHVSRLCDGLAAHEVTDGGRQLRVRGHDRPRSRAAGLLLDLAYTRRAVRAAPDADIVVTNTFWAPLLLRRRQGAICVDVQRMPRGQLRLYRRAARLRANSSAVAAAIAAEAPGLASRVRLIPNPLPFVPGTPVDWSQKSPLILYAGRVHPEKGLDLLLPAWASLRKAGKLPGWRLEIAGTVKGAEGGGGEDWWAALSATHRDAGAFWHGPVHEPEKLNALYRAASVFVYPSVMARGETFGQAILEAMSWGALPVVSDLACFRDFVRHGQNGLVFDHAGANPTEELGAALERAAQPGARNLAERAIDVRSTHATAAIAAQFLEDFAGLAKR